MAELFHFNFQKNTGVFFNNKNFLIKKFYINNNQYNNKYLKNELNGYSWYLKRLKRKNINIKVKSIKQNYFEIPLILGKKINFWKRIIHLKDRVSIILNHYKEIWPNKLLVPYHGDLTLDNIIFTDDRKVLFIDWENYSEKEEWGLDLVYFLLSLIILPSITNKKKIINITDIDFFKFHWNKVFKNKDYNYLNDPLEYLKTKQNLKNNFFFKINLDMKKQINNALKT